MAPYLRGFLNITGWGEQGRKWLCLAEYSACLHFLIAMPPYLRQEGRGLSSFPHILPYLLLQMAFSFSELPLECALNLTYTQWDSCL